MVNKINNNIIVIIYWKDHTADASWVDLTEARKQKPVICQTIGWLIDEDKESYRVADSITSDNGFGGINVILKSCVTDIWELVFPKAKNKHN